MIQSTSVNHKLFQNSVALVFGWPISSNTNQNPKQLLKNDRLTCSHCGNVGHSIEKWYKINGFLLGYKFTKGKTIGESSASSRW